MGMETVWERRASACIGRTDSDSQGLDLRLSQGDCRGVGGDCIVALRIVLSVWPS